jgi:hypothetical protein
MKKLSVLLLLLLITPRARAGCFSSHLREAIALNQAREPLYAALTGGKSKGVSVRLIAAERFSLLGAWVVERKAEKWEAVGVPALCADFVSMSLAPPFAAHAEPAVLNGGPAPVASLAWKTEIGDALARDGFPGVLRVVDEKIEQLRPERGYHCLVRHVLDSIARVAALAPGLEARSQEKGFAPGALSELEAEVIQLNLLGLTMAEEIDRVAEPIQQSGVPILCQDVPPIDRS